MEDLMLSFLEIMVSLVNQGILTLILEEGKTQEDLMVELLQLSKGHCRAKQPSSESLQEITGTQAHGRNLVLEDSEASMKLLAQRFARGLDFSDIQQIAHNSMNATGTSGLRSLHFTSSHALWQWQFDNMMTQFLPATGPS